MHKKKYKTPFEGQKKELKVHFKHHRVVFKSMTK